MARTLLVLLCVGSVFSLGYLAGVCLTQRAVENTARAHIERFSDEVHVLEGQVTAMEKICR